MFSTLRSVGALLLAAGILFVGSGLQGSLLAIRGNGEGFALAQIGLLMSTFYAGFVAGCQLTPGMVGRVGHIRTFTALASVASAVALAHVLIVDAYLWMVFRCVSGFCFAGLAMVIESWINERATNANRGRVLSIYRMVDLGALTLGQVLLTAADPGSYVLFAFVSILVSLALVPVALTTGPVPNPIESVRLDMRRVFRVSPLAFVGTLLVGLASSAFWSVGPVFVQDLGYGTGLIAAFMSVVILAGALAQWPLGLISDLIDRRLLVSIVALLAALSSALLVLAASRSPTLVLVGGGLFGAFGMSLFGLFVAQANDYAEPTEYVALNAGLLLLYGVGSIIGPLLASQAMQWFGTDSLFAYTTLVYVLMFGYTLWRMARRSAAPVETQDAFVSVPMTSPLIFELDPRIEEQDESASEAPREDPAAG
jgi:MFS family permease